MSGRPLDLTQRQIKALCEGARKAGYIPVVEIGKTVVRLVPEEHAIPKASPLDVDGAGPEPSAYEKWKAGRNARAS